MIKGSLEMTFREWYAFIKPEFQLDCVWEPHVTKYHDELLQSEFADIPLKDISTYDTHKDFARWAHWALVVFKGQLDDKMQLYFVSHIIDPINAFLIYLNYAELTDESDRVLENVFKGKMPDAEYMLKAGVHKRAKDG